MYVCRTSNRNFVNRCKTPHPRAPLPSRIFSFTPGPLNTLNFESMNRLEPPKFSRWPCICVRTYCSFIAEGCLSVNPSLSLTIHLRSSHERLKVELLYSTAKQTATGLEYLLTGESVYHTPPICHLKAKLI